MKLLLTGGTGYLGGFLRAAAAARGDSVTLLSRRQPGVAQDWIPFDLNAPPTTLPLADALIHAAFDHIPGRYRGGEGSDPDGFLCRNRDGSLALFDAAHRVGIPRIVFLSTRAVYGTRPPGTALSEDLPPLPDTLYGQMKWEVEQAVAAAGGMSLRVTGVYGAAKPGGWHKWQDLFADFREGRPIAPRQGTEVHGEDMAAAVQIALTAPDAQVKSRAFNVSDILLDRRDLLKAYAERLGLRLRLPQRAPSPAPTTMTSAALENLGWQPGGIARLHRFLDVVSVRNPEGQ